jgi:hypothetical protein
MPKQTKTKKRSSRPQAAFPGLEFHGEQGGLSTTRGIALLKVILPLGLPGILFGLFLAARPQVDIGSHDPVDASHPLAVSFPVMNHGRFSVYGASYFCRINELLTNHSGSVRNQVNKVHMHPNDHLDPGESYPFVCGLDISNSGEVTKAEIDIAVMFRPQFLPELEFKCARFILDTRAPDHPRWGQYPGRHCESAFADRLPRPLPETVLFPPVLWFW